MILECEITVVKPTDDEKCACSEHLAVFYMMKLLDVQEIETLLAPYFLQKGHFFIFFEKNMFFLTKWSILAKRHL